MINLFKNALEAMPQGGLLTVGLKIQGDFLELTVEDTGQDITPENLKLLFTPFFSTKEGGTGLGLTICRGLMSNTREKSALTAKSARVPPSSSPCP